MKSLYSNKKEEIVSSLPLEILDLILFFYTNQFQGLIHFSTICKQWKEISTRSKIWLECELTFYSSNNYLRANQHMKTIYLFDEEILYYPRTYKIKIMKNKRAAPVLVPQSEEIEALSSFSIQAKDICIRFMKIFRDYHERWDRYGQKVAWLRRHLTFFTSMIDRYLMICILLSPIFLGFGCAMFLFWNISTENCLRVENHLGFLCFYLFGLQFVGYFILLIPIGIHELIHKSDDETEPAQVLTSSPFCLNIMIIVLILGILISLGLWQYALANSARNFRYGYILIPLWISVTLFMIIGGGTILREIPQADRFMTLVAFAWPAVVMIGILIGFTLLGAYYDTADHYPEISLEMVVFCWYPFLLTILAFLFLSIAGNIEQMKKVRAHPNHIHSLVRCISELLRTLFVTGMFASMLYFNVIAVSSSNDSSFLFQSLVCLIVWLQCFVSALYIAAKQEA